MTNPAPPRKGLVMFILRNWVRVGRKPFVSSRGLFLAGKSGLNLGKMGGIPREGVMKGLIP